MQVIHGMEINIIGLILLEFKLHNMLIIIWFLKFKAVEQYQQWKLIKDYFSLFVLRGEHLLVLNMLYFKNLIIIMINQLI
jgi:hypothetical protein